jgi:hypothetical protein
VAQQLTGAHKVSAFHPFIFQKSGKSTIKRNLAVRRHFVSYQFTFVFVLFCIYTPDDLFPRPIVNQSGGLFWIPSDSNVSLEEQIWLTECIYLTDYFKLRKKKKKQNEMSFIITW